MYPLERHMAHLARAAVGLGAFLVFAGLPTSLWFQQQNPPIAMPWSLIAGGWMFGAAVVALIWRFGAPRMTRVQTAMASWRPSLLTALIVGVVLRVVISAIVHPLPMSDGATYLSLAKTLVATQKYGFEGSRAFWPPGLPFFLAPLIVLFGTDQTMLIVYGVLTFLIAGFGVFHLGRIIGLGTHAAWPVWLLALWPTLILCVGLPEKELLLVALLPWTMYFAIRAFRGSAAAAIVGGLLLGCVTLSQPSFQFLILLPFCLIPFCPGKRWAATGRSVLVLVAMSVVVAPWVVRNMQVLDGAAVIGTNGGGVLYRANNELATGAYTAKGQIDLDGLDEVKSDSVGRKLALEWIRSHPAPFLRLTASRTLLFAGDDSYGAFAALRRGQAGGAGGVMYAIGKLATIVPWILLWAVAAASVARRDFVFVPFRAWPFVAFVPYIYLSGIHAIFESGGRYHFPATSCLFVGVVWIVLGARSAPVGS